MRSLPEQSERGSERFDYGLDDKLEICASISLCGERAESLLDVLDVHLRHRYNAEADATIMTLVLLLKREVTDALDLADVGQECLEPLRKRVEVVS